MGKQKMSRPRFELWKNKGNKYGYRIIGGNGENIEQHNQGWSRIAGVVKNVKAIYRIGGLDVGFVRIKAGPVAGQFVFPNGGMFNMYWVDAPVTKSKGK